MSTKGMILHEIDIGTTVHICKYESLLWLKRKKTFSQFGNKSRCNMAHNQKAQLSHLYIFTGTI